MTPEEQEVQPPSARLSLRTCSSPLLSASTLNESELQYSVGGAEVEYPAGGPSTSAQASVHAQCYTCEDRWYNCPKPVGAAAHRRGRGGGFRGLEVGCPRQTG